MKGPVPPKGKPAGGLPAFDPNAFKSMQKDRAMGKGAFEKPMPGKPAPKKPMPAPTPLKHKYNSGVEKAISIMGPGDKPKGKMKGKKK